MFNEAHRRRSLRLAGYNYRTPGTYYVTICAQDRACLFGAVTAGEMRLSDAGQMIRRTWNELSARYPGVETDAFIIMPNHVHGVIFLLDSAVDGSSALSLPDVVQRFKSLTTTRYRQGVHGLAWPSFRDRLWQRNYYEHVVRSTDSLERIRRYIMANPLNWISDAENPDGGVNGSTA